MAHRLERLARQVLGPGAGAAAAEGGSSLRPSACAAAFPSGGVPVALVTGSSSGIGQAIAERLAAEGYRLVVNSSSNVEGGEAVARSLPGDAVYVRADCGNEADCGRLIEQVIDKCGRLDVLICNQGINKVIPHADLDKIDSEFLHKVFAVNLFGSLWLSRAAIPHLRKSPNPNIIFTSSVAGLRPVGSSVPYSMAKASLNHLAKLLAKSQGPVRVNVVAPGLIKTRITSGPEWDAVYQKCEAELPARRVGVPDDMVEVILSMLSSRYMTGQVVAIDGGSSILF